MNTLVVFGQPVVETPFVVACLAVAYYFGSPVLAAFEITFC
jgi:hypothetical protein